MINPLNKMFSFYTQRTINKRKTNLDSTIPVCFKMGYILSNKGKKNAITLSRKSFKKVKKGQIRNYEKWQIRQLVKKDNAAFSF